MFYMILGAFVGTYFGNYLFSLIARHEAKKDMEEFLKLLDKYQKEEENKNEKSID